MSASEPKPVDFDQMDVDIPKLVLQAKQSAAAAEQSVESAEADVKAGEATTNQVERRIVVFKKGTLLQHAMSLIRAAGGQPTKDLHLIDAVALVMPKTKARNVETALQSLQEVVRVDKDFVQNWLNSVPAVQPVPALPALPKPLAADPPSAEAQKTPWGIDRVHARDAWSVTRGQGVKVAVVDTGIAKHADLKIAGGYNCIDPAKPFDDDHGHGTHVAGTIAAQDNDQDVVGVAPDVTLYGVKVLSGDGSGTFADIVEGIQWCVDNKMDLANFSLGASEGEQALADAIKAAAAAGLTIVAAAGNSGGAVGYPAAYPEVVAVAASDSKDKVAYFSSRGPEVDVIAPGVSVNSLAMGGGTTSMSGTSMACPHMTGLAALAAAAQGLHGPDAIRAALIRAATPIPNVPAEQQGAGMVDAGQLVR
ncbi:MAG: S8 family peptidase [Elusimicrobiota bacterium]